MKFDAAAFRKRGLRTAAVCWMFAVLALCGQAAHAQSTEGTDLDMGPLSGGKWIEIRSPVEYPGGDVWIGDGLLGPRYFDWKSRLWTKSGVNFSGNIAPSIQWGSNDGTPNIVAELLFLFDWEVWRDDKSAGRLITGIAHDQTLGSLTTREFADNQGLVSTPNDLDLGSDRTFTTLGLFHWEQEHRTGPASGFGFRAGQLFTPPTSRRRPIWTTTGSTSWPHRWAAPTVPSGSVSTTSDSA